MERSICRHDERSSGKVRLNESIYLIVAIIATLCSSWIAQVVFAIAALIWLIPDRRIEERSFHVTGPSDWTSMTRAGHNGAKQ